MAMMAGRWEVMRTRREEQDAEDAMDVEMGRVMDAAEAAERAAVQERERVEKERAEQRHEAATEVERRSMLRQGDAVTTTRVMRGRVAVHEQECERGCANAWADVCQSCQGKQNCMCAACASMRCVGSGDECTPCRRAMAGACAPCLDALRAMCVGCRAHANRHGAPAGSSATQRGGHGSVPPLKKTRRLSAADTTAGPPRAAAQPRARPVSRAGSQAIRKKPLVCELGEPTRWRRRRGDGGCEVIEFDRRGNGTGWEAWFHVKTSPIAGRGLYAARPFAHKDAMVTYMGRDLGGEGTAEGTRAREQLAAVHRADHIMVVKGRYIDGRHGVTGAQYINAAHGSSGCSDNAKFGPTATVTVEKKSGIAAGEEVLMAYGQEYWRHRDTEARVERRDERVGGFAAYSKHDGGRVAFIEEIISAPTARGRQLAVGTRLIRHVVNAADCNLEEVHLVVARDNAHARHLYESLGFTPCTQGRVHAVARDSTDEYWAARVEVLSARLSSSAVDDDASAAWEVEVAERAGHLRTEDRAWAARLYNDAHGCGARQRSWGRDHAQGAVHVVMWRLDMIGIHHATAAASGGSGAAKRVCACTNADADTRAHESSGASESSTCERSAPAAAHEQWRAATGGSSRTDGEKQRRVATTSRDQPTRNGADDDHKRQRCAAGEASKDADHAQGTARAVRRRGDKDGISRTTAAATHDSSAVLRVHTCAEAGGDARARECSSAGARGPHGRDAPATAHEQQHATQGGSSRTGGTQQQCSAATSSAQPTQSGDVGDDERQHCTTGEASRHVPLAAADRSSESAAAAVQAARRGEQVQGGYADVSSAPRTQLRSASTDVAAEQRAAARPLTSTAAASPLLRQRASAASTDETSLLRSSCEENSGKRGRATRTESGSDGVNEEAYGRGVKKKKQECDRYPP